MHPCPTPTRLPRWGPRRRLRCSSLKYSRYCHPTAQTTRGGGPGSRSSAFVRGTLSQRRTSAKPRRSLGGGGSRLAGGAPRPSRCDARLLPRAAKGPSRNTYKLKKRRELRVLAGGDRPQIQEQAISFDPRDDRRRELSQSFFE